MRRRVLLCFVLALASGCQGDDATKPKTTSAPPPPSSIISDGNHNGNPDFFFLPPMVANPSGSTNWDAAGFDGSYTGPRAPIVAVCLLSATSEAQVPSATCTGSPLVSAPAIVDLANQQYQFNWRVPDVSATTFYRVAVLLLGNQIGLADVEVVPSASQLKNVKTLDVVPLADNRTLPIKFRIQHNVLCNASMTSGFCSIPVDLSAGGSVQTTLPGGTLPSGVTIPSGAGSGTVNIAVQPCESFRYRATDLPVFGPCVRITATPALPPSGLAAAATVFVCDVSDATITQGVGGDVLDHDQADRITLHQLDPDPNNPNGQVLRALPHAAACGGGTTSSRTDGSFGRLFAAVRRFDVRGAFRQAAALLTPRPLYAARFIDLGGGGSTAFFSDFQFALPAGMQVVKSTNGQAAYPNSMLSSAVSVLVTDVGARPVRNARVTFAVASGGGALTPVSPSETCPATNCAVALTDEDGIANATWTLGPTQGANSLLAIGRGIAGDDNNGPRVGVVDPFQPIQSHFDGTNPPGGATPVVVQTGTVNFSAFGLFATGFEPVDASWISDLTPAGFWHTSTLTSVANSLYPSLVQAALNDNSAGALPGPFAGADALWFGVESGDSRGSYAGALGDPSQAGGTSSTARSGTAVSPIFLVPPVPNAVQLRFESWFEIESVNPSHFDLMTVRVFDADADGTGQIAQLNPAADPQGGAAAIPFTSGGFNRAPVWVPVTLDLSAYRGRHVRLIFSFDTRDILYNGFRGWIVDNVMLEVLSTTPVATRIPLAHADVITSSPPPERTWHP